MSCHELPGGRLGRAWREDPGAGKGARFLTRLASFARLILFDKRDTGLSDRNAETAVLVVTSGRNGAIAMGTANLSRESCSGVRLKKSRLEALRVIHP